MGDVAMTVPVLRAFSRQYRQVKLTVISRPFFEPFFEGIPNLDFFAFDDKKRHKGFLGLMRLFADLRKLDIDAFADLHNVLRSQVIRRLFTLSGKKTAFTDKGRAEKKALTAPHHKAFQPLRTMVERHADTFKKLGFKISLKQPEFSKKQPLAPEIHNFTGEKTAYWIGIAPFAQYDSKAYPLDLMAQTIALLAQTENSKIFLFGGGGKEASVLDGLSKNHPNVVNMAGKVGFREELALISNLDVMLSMDSGNGHLAAMLGVPVVTLWGATHPFAGFAPFNQPLSNALVSDREKYPMLPTSVYGNKTVEGYEDAMRTIAPETVAAKIKQLLN